MEEQFISEFAKRLTKLRIEKGISARDMSLSLGLSHNFINSIEAEKNYPSMLNFIYICEFLGISPKDFFDYDNSNPELFNELYVEVKRLDKKSQEYFLGLIIDVNNRPK